MYVQKQFYVCMCSKPYIRKAMLEKHKQKNTKISACRLCNQTFSLTCCFKHHLQLEHEIKLHLCCLCSEYFKTKRTLTAHIRNYHTAPAVTFLPISSVPHIQNNHPEPPSPPVHLTSYEKSIYFSNLISLLNTKNFSLYPYQLSLDNSLFLQWTHNT